MRAALLLAFGFVAGCASEAAEQNRIMDEIEAQIVMPPGAEPLEAYRRYYYPALQGTKVLGMYLKEDEAGRSWREGGSPSAPSNVGCNAVNLIYDRAAGRFESIACSRTVPPGQDGPIPFPMP